MIQGKKGSGSTAKFGKGAQRTQRGIYIPILSFFAVIFFLSLASCELYRYGKLEGADQTAALRPGDDAYESLLGSLSGVWYSHYAGIGRLDGYRIGKWKDFDAVMEGKTALLPNLDPARETYTDESGSFAPGAEDFFLFYDSSVYGQKDDSGAGVEPGWNHGFLGIVRAVNLFNGDKDRGAVIIEYVKGAAPVWDPDIKDGRLPFFGVYYRVLSPDIVQLANAVDLTAMYAGRKYYTEKATLQEAIDTNTVENEAEYIAWGVVIPQDREPSK
jgi:hypothetical protein